MSKLRYCWLLLLLAGGLRPSEAATYAVVCGISKYEHSPLLYADDDAAAFYNWLISKEGGSVPGDQVSVLINEEATRTAILRALARQFSKAGADAVVRCFANEFGHAGVRVNSIAPGLTATPMTAAAMQAPGLEAAFAREYPLGRIGSSDDVAGAAVWLASDESFLTGQVLQINGGLTLRRNPTSAEVQASIGKAMAKLQGSG